MVAALSMAYVQSAFPLIFTLVIVQVIGISMYQVYLHVCVSMYHVYLCIAT